MIYNKFIISIFIVVNFVQFNSCKQKTEVEEFSTLAKVFQDLDICLNVNENAWNDSLKKMPELQEKWRFFCDTTYFKLHKVGPEVNYQDIVLLEVKINHGSGEYDNYIIKKYGDKYRVTAVFKGYYDGYINNGKYYKFIYQFNTSSSKSCKVLGTFDGEKIVTDTILNLGAMECRDAFFKGKAWID